MVAVAVVVLLEFDSCRCVCQATIILLQFGSAHPPRIIAAERLPHERHERQTVVLCVRLIVFKENCDIAECVFQNPPSPSYSSLVGER